MTPTEKAEHLIAFMQYWGLTNDEMLEVIAIAKRKLEAMKYRK